MLLVLNVALLQLEKSCSLLLVGAGSAADAASSANAAATTAAAEVMRWIMHVNGVAAQIAFCFNRIQLQYKPLLQKALTRFARGFSPWPLLFRMIRILRW